MSVEKYISSGVFDLDKFYRDIQVVVDAMDSIIDLNKHPDPRQEKANKFTRKIGLGIMGLADALAKLGIPYDSDEAVAFTLILSAALEVFSWKRSWELARERGVAPAFKCRVFDWNRMECLESSDPCELSQIHIPALEKQRLIRVDDVEWVKIRYHDVSIPEDVYLRLSRDVRAHLDRDGTVRLVKRETLMKVLREVFDIEQPLRDSDFKEVISDPRQLVLMAVFHPHRVWSLLRDYGMSLGVCAPRNTVMTTVAPTGSISILAGTSSGIEPYFAIVYKRRISIGEFTESVNLFKEKIMELKGLTSEETVNYILEEISKNKGSLRRSKVWEDPMIPTIVARDGIVVNLREILEDLARIFPTSLDVGIWYHLAHQIAAQLYIDQAISKTINLVKDASVDDVFTTYFTAWIAGLKGVTVYRDESKAVQVINFGLTENAESRSTRRAKRMVIPRRRMSKSEISRDPILSSLVKTVEVEENVVVVDVDKNSTCETCDL